MAVIPAEADEDSRFLFSVTDEGYAKRTPVSEFRRQNRGGLGVRAMRLNDERGGLVAALVVSEEDEVISFKASGQVIRSAVADVSPTGRDTMGVKFVGIKGDDQVVAVTVNPELEEDENAEETGTESIAPAESEVASDDDGATVGQDVSAEREATDE